MFTLPKHLMFSNPYLVLCLLGTELILTASLRAHQHTEQNKSKKSAYALRNNHLVNLYKTQRVGTKGVKSGYFLYRVLKKVLPKVLTSEKF